MHLSRGLVRRRAALGSPPWRCTLEDGWQPNGWHLEWERWPLYRLYTTHFGHWHVTSDTRNYGKEMTRSCKQRSVVTVSAELRARTAFFPFLLSLILIPFLLCLFLLPCTLLETSFINRRVH